MRTSLVVAADLDDVIGKDGGLPWHLPADLRWFRGLTTGHVVVAGRRTHASIVDRLGRPLPDRVTVVVSRQPPAPAGTVVHATSVAHALELAGGIAAWAGRDECFVIGGAQLYDAALPAVDRIYLTRVQARVQGDTAMPTGWLDGFSLTSAVDGDPSSELPYRHETYERAP